VKDDVAFVANGAGGSMAVDAYRNICTEADVHKGNFSQ